MGMKSIMYANALAMLAAAVNPSSLKNMNLNADKLNSIVEQWFAEIAFIVQRRERLFVKSAIVPQRRVHLPLIAKDLKGVLRMIYMRNNLNAEYLNNVVYVFFDDTAARNILNTCGNMFTEVKPEEIE